jgi:hypothetical protein
MEQSAFPEVFSRRVALTLLMLLGFPDALGPNRRLPPTALSTRTVSNWYDGITKSYACFTPGKISSSVRSSAMPFLFPGEDCQVPHERFYMRPHTRGLFLGICRLGVHYLVAPR